jgi:hypothetical protein
LLKSVVRLKWRTRESLTCFAAAIRFLCFIGSSRRIVDQIDLALLTHRFLARAQFLREGAQLFRSAPHLLHDTSCLNIERYCDFWNRGI